MLPVKKQDTDLDDASPNAVVGFSKVLSSIQGLQQRLGDFSYGEVSIAEAKVKILVKQLSLLRDNLNSLIRLKHTVGEVNHLQSDILVQRFDQVNLHRLEKYPQLHAILEASKVVPLPRPMSGDFAGSDAVSQDTETAGSPNHPLAPQETGAETAFAPTGIIDNSEFTEAMDSTPEDSGDTCNYENGSVTGHSAPPKTSKSSFPAKEPRSFTIPNESSAAFQDTRADGQSIDWSFESLESALASSENFTAPMDFEFPDDTLEDPQPVSKKVAKTKPPQSERTPTAKIPQASPDKPDGLETKAEGAAQTIPAQPGLESSAARLDESKALVPADANIDQRLLAEVIKNYGDFAGSPYLPATLDANTKIMPATDAPAKNPADETAQAAAAERKILNVQKSGDLDRQLKKIIKDYGEYDIYQRQSGISFKTGGIIAFAVLGVVLAALYLFRAPRAESTPQAGSVKQSQLPEARNTPEAVGSPAVEPHVTTPEAVDAVSGSLKDDKQ